MVVQNGPTVFNLARILTWGSGERVTLTKLLGAWHETLVSTKLVIEAVVSIQGEWWVLQPRLNESIQTKHYHSRLESYPD